MKRLTKKNSKGFYEPNMTEMLNGYGACVQKLGELENIEEELGIDLITLYKAFNGLWYKSKDGEIEFSCHIALTDTVWELRIIEGDAFPSKTLALRDYGRTWALTKEELL